MPSQQCYDPIQKLHDGPGSSTLNSLSIKETLGFEDLLDEEDLEVDDESFGFLRFGRFGISGNVEACESEKSSEGC
ncbi:hypothetical protein AMTR_s00004p00224650 [Amborella trichopoda]|uniref:Uncharacterized protein n=1 Tax=Amborella trichopoda TaxID=13333 RepID=W1NE87_AMBTC|nr:hypothetical protein AMTR_s00004p00224650 [Amborella trichopoda]